MQYPNMQEYQLKEQRIHQFMEENGWDALVIGTQHNFSWLACGGASRVLITSEGAVSILVITKTHKYLVAYSMDAPRLLNEDALGLGFEPVVLRWYEKSLEEAALELVAGKRVLSDIPLKGAVVNGQEFYKLYYPLTDSEVDRYRLIGKESEQIVRSVADRTVPEMTEAEVEGLLISEYALKGYLPAVVLVGSDERIDKYRHPPATDKKIDRTLMIILALKKYGLHAVLTRMVYFGDQIPAETARRFEAASTIEANCIANSVPGTKFADILEMQKRLYKELGYEEEWRNHFQGGITSYIPNDSSLCFVPGATMVDRQAYNWFITITGVNTEDIFISNKDKGEIITCAGAWPVKTYLAAGKEISLPEILCM